jgi:hypothetical protein
MQAINERLFLTKLTKVMFLAPSYFFSDTYMLLTLFGTDASYKIKARPNTPERI